LSADVTSGSASLTQILIEEFMQEETPKAPILLYACEGKNPFSGSIENTGLKYKYDLFDLNPSFWIGSLSRLATMVIPFNE
jgi:hypothetical protein